MKKKVTQITIAIVIFFSLALVALALGGGLGRFIFFTSDYESLDICEGPGPKSTLDDTGSICPDKAFAIMRDGYEFELPRCRKCFEKYITFR